MLPVALQLYSVRDELDKDFLGTLKKVKEMGYDGVELSGLGGRDPKMVKDALDELGLIVMSSHVPVEELSQDDAMDRYKAAGCDYVVIPGIRMGKNCELMKRNIGIIRDLAEKASKKGLKVLYHNHDFEFYKVNGHTILDTIYEEIPAEILETQIDTCWAKFAGTDPAAYVLKYSGRAPLVHLKDYWVKEGYNSTPYDIIGEKKQDEKESGFEFRPIGHGVQDMTSILAAAQKAGAKLVIVEQDESFGRPTLEAAKMSIDYLRSFEW